MLKTLTSALAGTSHARNNHRLALQKAPSIESGIIQLQELCPYRENDPEAPIFLLSAGWRSGSTLLQRLIMSDPKVLIWGEPYDECGLIQALADTLKAFRPGWPPPEYFYDFYARRTSEQLTGKWIANLFPALPDWRNAHRALFDTLFSLPAKQRGASRWGIKEVRLGVEHCAYLRWLYPNARFILLYRNPLESYRSYCRYGRSWYDVFPDKPVFTPAVFGRHWRQLMEGFLREAESLKAILVRYEDLVSGHAPLDELESYLDIKIDRSVLNTKVGSSERNGRKAEISLLERWLLKRSVGPLAKKLGYQC